MRSRQGRRIAGADYDRAITIAANILSLAAMSTLIFSAQYTSKKFLLSAAIFVCACISLPTLLVLNARSSSRWSRQTIEASVLLLAGTLSLSIIYTCNYEYFIWKFGNSPLSNIPPIVFVAAILLSLYILWRAIQCRVRTYRLRDHHSISDYVKLAIVCTVVFLSSLPIFSAWMRSDTYGYFYAFSELDIESINSSAAKLAGHISYFYSYLGFVINQLIGDYAITLRVINMGLFLISIYSFYSIVNSLLHQSHAALLATVVYAFCPLSYGLLHTISIDNIAMYLLVIFLALYSQQYYILGFAVFVGMVFTKETMALISAAALVGFMYRDWMLDQHKINFCKLKTILNLPFSIPAGLSGVLWATIYIGSAWGNKAGNQYLSMSGDIISQFNQFGFNGVYIADKLATLFSNFNWVLFGIIIICLCMPLVRRVKLSEMAATLLELSPYIVSMGSILFYNFAYITYNNFRYWQPISPLLILVCSVLLCKCSAARVYTPVSAALAVLMLVSSFITIDPYMLNLLPVASTGPIKIASSRNRIMGQEEFYFGDVYNRQFMYFDYAFDEALSSSGFHSQDTLLVSDEYRAPSDGGGVGSISIINGFGYESMETPRYVCWEGDRRLLSGDSSANGLEMVYVDSNSYLPDARSTNVYYIEMPWGDTVLKQIVLMHYNITQAYTTNSRGWRFVVYKLN